MIFSPAYLAGSTVLHEGPYLRIVLAEFVDVGISEHTGDVCAMPRANDQLFDRFTLHEVVQRGIPSKGTRARRSPAIGGHTW